MGARLPFFRTAAALVVLLTGAAPLLAGPVLDRVKSGQVIRCGSAARPGLLTLQDDGRPVGLLADLCRAVGMAAAGLDVKVVWDVLEADTSYDAIPKGQDDLLFLDGAEIVDHKLAGIVLPGPVVFFETTGLMVPNGSPAQRLADLAGQPICFPEGDAAHPLTEAWFAAHHLSFVRMGYQEEEEMLDAFDSRRCKAMAGPTADLATWRLSGGATLRSGRILDQNLATIPILAATGTNDAPWSAVVAWTIGTLQAADRPARAWSGGGTNSLPLTMPELGLDAGWQARVLAASGTYAAMLRRNVGEASPLRLPPGPNALAGQDGLLMPPAAD